MKQAFTIFSRAFVFAVFLCISGNVYSQVKAFSFTCQVEQTNLTRDFSFNSFEAGDYSVNWGDGSIIHYTGNQNYQSCSHTYTSIGTYIITVNSNIDINSLNISNQKVTSLDVSGLTYLSNLKCENNSLISLDLSSSNFLSYLYCYNNSLTSLNVSGLTSLMFLRCDNNQLTSLDVSDCSILFYLYCGNNRLNTLNVSGLNSLFALDCSNNSLSTIDLSGLSSLSILDCYNNSISKLELNDLSSLSKLDCSNNSLSNLDVSILSSLSKLNCSNNSLSNLDLTGLSRLSNLDCSNNYLLRLDVSNLSSLSTLNCNNNSLTKLNVSGLNALSTLYCSNNSLSKLDLNDLSSLSTLDCSNNKLFTLDLSGLTSLSTLYCYNNSLTLSELYAASGRILSTEDRYLGTQNLPTQTVSINDVIDLSSEPVFEGVATDFQITRNGVLVSDYNVNAGMLNIFTPGNYRLKMTNNAVASDLSAPAQVIVNFVVTGATGTETVNQENISIYPNPTQGIVNIQGTSEQPTVKVYNMNGGLLESVVSSSVDLSTYSNGIYLLEVNGTIQKIVKE